MPLPNPRKKEKRSEFVSRCVSELTTKEEFKDSKQRVAVCYDIFKKKEAEASIVIGEGDDTQLFFEESEALQLLLLKRIKRKDQKEILRRVPKKLIQVLNLAKKQKIN
jgi:hypothetical protein